MTSDHRGISVIIPARDEEQTIGLVVRDCLKILGQMGLEHEIIVVDDGSSDGTAAAVQGLDCTLLRNQGPSHGKGAALRLGFAAARHSTFLMLDADYSHRAEDIPVLWGEFLKGYGLVVADRLIGGSDEYTFSRCYGNLFLTTVFSSLFGVQLNDSLNGFKIFERRVFDSFTYTAEDFSIEIELLANTRRLGLSIGQIRSHERARQGGRAKSFAVRHGFSFLFRILHERWRKPERR
jgi:glycosyltransferase involved in cell wall biosynthesis